MTSVADDSLPEWYPFANAPDKEIDGWLTAVQPPYDLMRDVLPWFRHEGEFDAWLASMRNAQAFPTDRERLVKVLPGIAKIPMPPRRTHSGE
jgi:hypothetical protein